MLFQWFLRLCDFARPGGVNVGFSYPCCSSGIAEICHLYKLLSARGCSLIQYIKYISLIPDDGALSSITWYSCTLGQWRPLSLQEWQDCYVCALCYWTQVSQHLQWIKLNLCVAGTMFSPQIQGLYSVSWLWILGSSPFKDILHLLYTFSLIWQRIVFVHYYPNSIGSAQQWTMLANSLLHNLKSFYMELCCLHYLSLLCSLLRPNPSDFKRSMNFILISQN